MFKALHSEDYMTKQPVTFKPDTDLFDAIHVILEKHISGATVINDNNEVVGVISEVDCLKAILDGSYYGNVGGHVSDFMTTDFQSIGDHLDIMDIAKLLIENRRRRIPVIKDGKFIGQFSCRSVLQALKDVSVAHDNKEDFCGE
ncbi:MAG: CBS domain-containing protein [Gammaproteobacteria bacterium]|nr:MAG: CBS domain-containing protein [Gammaproteobacteria bacterium]